MDRILDQRSFDARVTTVKIVWRSLFVFVVENNSFKIWHWQINAVKLVFLTPGKVQRQLATIFTTLTGVRVNHR